MDPLTRVAGEVYCELLANHGVRLETKQLVYLHMQKPWVENFHLVAITPMKSGLEEFLDAELFSAGGNRWFYPSQQWWLSHAKTSHPPDGSGCDVDAHTSFLSVDGGDPEFLYGNLLYDGSFHVLGREDFVAECEWWARYAT